MDASLKKDPLLLRQFFQFKKMDAIHEILSTQGYDTWELLKALKPRIFKRMGVDYNVVAAILEEYCLFLYLQKAGVSDGGITKLFDSDIIYLRDLFNLSNKDIQKINVNENDKKKISKIVKLLKIAQMKSKKRKKCDDEKKMDKKHNKNTIKTTKKTENDSAVYYADSEESSYVSKNKYMPTRTTNYKITRKLEKDVPNAPVFKKSDNIDPLEYDGDEDRSIYSNTKPVKFTLKKRKKISKDNNSLDVKENCTLCGESPDICICRNRTYFKS